MSVQPPEVGSPTTATGPPAATATWLMTCADAVAPVDPVKPTRRFGLTETSISSAWVPFSRTVRTPWARVTWTATGPYRSGTDVDVARKWSRSGPSGSGPVGDADEVLRGPGDGQVEGPPPGPVARRSRSPCFHPHRRRCHRRLGQQSASRRRRSGSRVDGRRVVGRQIVRGDRRRSERGVPVAKGSPGVTCREPASREAAPVPLPPVPPGSPRVPVPVNWIVRTPWPSSAVMTQPSVVEPTAVGEKVTDSVRVSPGSIVVPSGRVVVAVNGPSTGGFDLEMSGCSPRCWRA